MVISLFFVSAFLVFSLLSFRLSRSEDCSTISSEMLGEHETNLTKGARSYHVEYISISGL